VQVRIMLENQPFSYTNDTYEDIARIADQSPSFVLQNDEILNLNYLHSKYFIFDDRAAIVQTSNLTHA
jgi:phosphatidylserine/phosphatidylglycerophosphate/cardiolipin synthase-like enzyme